MKTDDARKVLLEQIETDHQKIDLHAEWDHIPNPSWACAFCQEDWPCAPVQLTTHLRAALADERAVWVVRFVRACLDADNGLERLTQAFGDAPSDCGCREASCPHVPWFPLSDESVVEMIESARAKMREES